MLKKLKKLYGRVTKMESITLYKALNILSKAYVNLSHKDYVEIWGEELGNHIWRQHGSDLLKIWRSRLTKEQVVSLVVFIKKKYQ